jgi:transcriptional regulator with XRE-family HTH domain
MTANQAKMPEPGPAGHNLIANVEQLREVRHLSLRALSVRLGDLGHPLITSAVHAIVQGKRKVSVDDLVALAEVLGVTPDVLLSAPEAVRRHRLEVPAAVREARNLTAQIESLTAASGDPAASGLASGYVDRALRRVQIEVEELLADTRRSVTP